MGEKQALVVLDFDGFLINSYELLRSTFGVFGLDIGDEERFRNRRKFLKYVGGGREILGNLVWYSLPKRKALREVLTTEYLKKGRIYAPFVPLVNRLVECPRVHVGLVSRNFTRSPGATIRTVLANSGIQEEDLDFVIPIPAGSKKRHVLEGMISSRFERSLMGADEISDYEAAAGMGYETVIGSYGFDTRDRLIRKGGVPEETIVESPEVAAEAIERLLASFLA